MVQHVVQVLPRRVKAHVRQVEYVRDAESEHGHGQRVCLGTDEYFTRARLVQRITRAHVIGDVIPSRGDDAREKHVRKRREYHRAVEGEELEEYAKFIPFEDALFGEVPIDRRVVVSLIIRRRVRDARASLFSFGGVFAQTSGRLHAPDDGVDLVSKRIALRQRRLRGRARRPERVAHLFEIVRTAPFHSEGHFETRGDGE